MRPEAEQVMTALFLVRAEVADPRPRGIRPLVPRGTPASGSRGAERSPGVAWLE